MRKIIYPTRLSAVILQLLVTSGILLLATFFNRYAGPLLILFAFYFIAAVTVLCTRYPLLREYRDLRLLDGAISINGEELAAKDIVNIRIMGYFKQTIGIKPHGKRMVPMAWCFRYAQDEDEAVRELTAWAERHGVSLRREFFYKWI